MVFDAQLASLPRKYNRGKMRTGRLASYSQTLAAEDIKAVLDHLKIERAHVAGLSMGGSESLLTGLNNVDKFAWIGAFSSGGLPEEFHKDFPGLDAKANQQLKLLWIACGVDDRLIELNRTLRAWLEAKGVHKVDVETPGAHTWMVWRRNLATFTPLLFR